MGGQSTEREISLSSGNKVLAALDPAAYDAVPIIVEDHATFLREGLSSGTLSSGNGAAAKVDAVFIAMHGAFGEDGTVQGMLDLLGIPYTGSGVLASALAMDKAMSKRIFMACAIPTPPWRMFTPEILNADIDNLWAETTRELGVPLVVKPNSHGSSVGVRIVREFDEFAPALAEAAGHDRNIMVERCIEGMEISVGVLGNDKPEALPVVEIVPRSGFYDYEAKYTVGATEEICPARLPEPIAQRAQRIAVAAHEALGCRCMSRVDMMVAGEEIQVLEVNTIPGMTDTSLLPLAAQAIGMEYPALVDRLVQLSIEGYR